MAIGPHQLNEAFNEEVKHFESRIDSQLAKKSIGFGGSASVDYPSGMTQQHFQILKERYLSAGWKSIEDHHDQRDGSCIIFRS
jgi:hypothetical protein